jgi:hypothetical protein
MGRGVHYYHASSPSLMILHMVGGNPASQIPTYSMTLALFVI